VSALQNLMMTAPEPEKLRTLAHALRDLLDEIWGSIRPWLEAPSGRDRHGPVRRP
jgi:hypothetical protein